MPSKVPFQIKICGITSVDDAFMAADSGSDAIGLNFYQQSRRSVTLDQANTIIKALHRHSVSSAHETAKLDAILSRERLKRVGVFVNHTMGEVVTTASRLKLDGVQLHGNESISFVKKLVDVLSRREKQPFIVRAIRACNEPNELARVAAEIQRWASIGVDAVLIDAAVPGEYGGTGKTVDWNAVSRLNDDSPIPIVLAGGLKPNNVQKAIQVSGVQAVDVASGVEISPGVKSHELVDEFVQHCQFDGNPNMATH
ncbi:MAG: phosphoribosylanthranilate isomerase [Planctomycetota bacterium]